MKIGFGENKVIIHVPYDLYTHVSTKNLSAIKNPLDSILKGGKT